ncbi:hypothetical protein LS48_11115 [Aequorivita aquimaris]|uniref:Uncharacterized protein n=1 Tax=Aequorivita aquimaris TaxID=1548749 RepID=A0A137RGK6_9FLAO|nr:hypothetical protein LS48_11115 [Aequorivita aquimaris]
MGIDTRPKLIKPFQIDLIIIAFSLKIMLMRERQSGFHDILTVAEIRNAIIRRMKCRGYLRKLYLLTIA